MKLLRGRREEPGNEGSPQILSSSPFPFLKGKVRAQLTFLAILQLAIYLKGLTLINLCVDQCCLRKRVGVVVIGILVCWK